MQPAMSSTLTVTNYAGIVQDQIETLLETYFQGMQVYTGHRSLGADDITFPCFMVELTKTSARMDRVQKWERKYFFTIYFYVKGANRDILAQQQSNYAEGLIKLFSNNAAGRTIGSAYGQGGYDGGPYGGVSAAGQFKNYDPYWWNSEFDGDIILSATWTETKNQNSYMRAGAAKMWFVASVIE